ncbi:MAG: hypothetical protein GXP31_07720 [Kiritimatiellaeota bacterium]|nr:hypothetical protein [Kiritimatiellota bacterium]
MVRRLLNKLLGRSEPEAPEATDTTPKKPRIKQVYEGPNVDRPEFARGIDDAELIVACKERVVCTYNPHIERQRIYKPGRRRVGGDLDTVYDGVAASCAAMKSFSAKVAEEDGLIQPYRYVDLNHIFACCCGNPKRCPFFLKANQERASINGRMQNIRQR